MARLLFLLLIISAISFNLQAQPNRQFAGPVESNLLREADKSFTLYLSVRIPYSELIFEKKDSLYNSGFTFTCELFENDKLVERKSIDEKVSVKTYNSTLDEETFLQALVSFKGNYSNYTVKPYLLRYFTNETIPLREFTVDPLSNPRLFRPFIASGREKGEEMVLVNKGGLIPWDGGNYFLLIPVSDSLSGTGIRVSQFQDTLYSADASTLKRISFRLKPADGIITVDTGKPEPSGNNYVILPLPAEVEEGDLQITIEQGKKRTIFNVPVVWIGKPMVLANIDLSAKLLNIITDGKAAENILSASGDMQYRLLKKEWDRIAGIEKGGVNPLMKEFYSRADFALKNFSWNGQMNGTESDRGKIYMRFGKPSEIERTYNNKNEITEIWYYENLKREFIFEDTGGKGNFILRR